MKVEGSFVIVAYLWVEICIFLCFGGHFGRHLGKMYWQTILTTINGFPDPETMKLESSFVIVAYLWAEICIFLCLAAILAAILESALQKLLQLLTLNSTVNSKLYFWLQVTYEKYLLKMHIHHEQINNDVEDEEG